MAVYRPTMTAIRRRGLRVFFSGSLALLLALGQLSVALADYHALDPIEGDPLDIVAVSSRVVGRPSKIRFTAHFSDSIDVSRRPFMQVAMDSKGGGLADAALHISTKADGTLKCVLKIGILIAKRGLRVRLGADSISCQVRRKLLPWDGTAIRWSVGVKYVRGFVIGTADEAPDFGAFPHV
jgi:hypothetical protein